MKKTPKLRFKEFSGDWQEKKVQELCDTITDYVAAGSFESIRNNVTYYNNDNFAQLIRTIDLKNNFKNKDFIFVDENAFNFLYRVNLNENSIILPNIGANIGESYYLEPNKLPNKNNVLGPNAILLKNKYNNTKYVYYLFNTKKFHKQLVQMIGASGQPKFNKTELKQMKFYIPSKEEQEKIASFLSLIDNKISLQSEKVEALKDYKKGMMQKIFNRELRFKDDEGRDYPEWEEKKLGDIVIKKKKGGNAVYCENGNILLNNEYMENNTKPSYVENEIDVNIKDILILWDGSQAGKIYTGFTGVLGSTFVSITLDKYNCNRFIYQQLIYNLAKIQIAWREGSGVPHVAKDFIENFKVKVPLLDEQIKISKILDRIDIKLKKEQEKLNSLNEYKKGLLQQMFI